MHVGMEMSRTCVNNFNTAASPELSDTITDETDLFRHQLKAGVPHELSTSRGCLYPDVFMRTLKGKRL
jgi:hypothetical protein